MKHRCDAWINFCAMCAFVFVNCRVEPSYAQLEPKPRDSATETRAQNGASNNGDGDKNQVVDSSDTVFGLTKLWQIHIRVSETNWNKMQPTGGGFPMGFGGPPQNGPGGRPAQFRPGSFGYEFDYVSADIQIGDEKLSNVGLRFKGNGTYMMSASNRKRPFKLDFNRFNDEQKFHGLQQLNLHNDVMDPTHLKSAVSYNVFRSAKVAAPRTAFAEVRLTIDGVCENEFLGLYSMVEEIDEAFLRRNYKSDKGMLLKPEGTQGLEYKGEAWEDYAWYEAKGKPSDDQKSKLIEITRLITQPDDQQFRDRIETMLDIDQFARFLAANTLLANMDSFLTQVHNYYLYLPPNTGKFEFLPWDMDLSFGAFFFAGSIEQLQDLSITHPHVGQNRLIERLMSWDKFTKIYRQYLKQLTEDCFGSEGTTLKELSLLQRELEKPLAAEAKRVQEMQASGGFGFGPPGFGPPAGSGGPSGGGPPGFGPPGFGATATTIEQFIGKRRQSILDQLEGKTQGTIPGSPFGPGGPFQGRPGTGAGPGPGPGPGPGALGSPPQPPTAPGSTPRGAGVPLPPLNSGPRPGEPQPFSLGLMQSPVIVASADNNSDGKVSNEEWRVLTEKWFKLWDKDGNGQLDRDEVSAGFDKSFPTIPPPIPAKN